MNNVPAQLTLDHVSPSTLLLEKQRQMHEVQTSLDAQKDEYARQAGAFKRREDSLRKKDLELQESLVQFNKFLKDKFDKRIKYDRMAQDERKQRLMKEKEIRSRQNFLNNLQSQFKGLKNQVREYEQYQAFLTKVQDENLSEWPELESILSRSQALDMAYKDLLERQNTMILKSETLRNEFSMYNKAQITANLNLNNRIAQLQSQLERAESNTAQKESEEDRRRQQKTERSRELSVIIMAVNNLYQRCAKQSSILIHSEQLKQYLVNRDAAASSGKVSVLPSDGSSDGKMSSDSPMQNFDTINLMLDVVGNYIIDFMAIVDEAGTNSKSQGRSNARLLTLDRV